MPKARGNGKVYHITTFWVKHPKTGTEVTREELHNKLKSCGLFKRFAMQLEKAPTTDQLHYQLSLHCFKKLRFETMANACGYDNDQWYFKEMTFEGGGLSLAANAYRYVTKEDTRIEGPWTEGDWADAIDELAGKNKESKPNQRDDDLLKIHRLVGEGYYEQDFYMEYPLLFTKYNKQIKDCVRVHQALNPPERLSEPPVVLVYAGHPGKGKTTSATDDLKAQGYTPYEFTSATKEDQKLFFTDYMPGLHDAIVFDDFYQGIDYVTLLKLTHEHPVRVNVHHGTIYIRPRAVVFTCNTKRGYPFKHYYDRLRGGDLGDGQDWRALLRRINKWYVFDGAPGVKREVDPHSVLGVPRE